MHIAFAKIMLKLHVLNIKSLSKQLNQNCKNLIFEEKKIFGF